MATQKMTDQFVDANKMVPIIPPPELVQQWLGEYFGCTVSGELSDSERYLAAQAARWGADKELEACLQWFSEFYCMETWMQKDLEKFRIARRPKPPSPKEEALQVLESLIESGRIVDPEYQALRHALERLNR